MNARKTKAATLARRIERRIFNMLDQRDMRGLLLVERWNAVLKVAYPGANVFTAGMMLDRWYEARAFEASF
jgi:hypothetical protein